MSYIPPDFFILGQTLCELLMLVLNTGSSCLSLHVGGITDSQLKAWLILSLWGAVPMVPLVVLFCLLCTLGGVLARCTWKDEDLIEIGASGTREAKGSRD